MSRQKAPYKHTYDNSPCWTKNCSRNNLNGNVVAASLVSAQDKLLSIFNSDHKNKIDLKERESRQGKGTLYHQLLRSGLTKEMLNERLSYKLNQEEVGWGTLSTYDKDEDPVIGLVYTGEYRHESERGIATIAAKLEAGALADEDVKYFEDSKGRGVLVIAADVRHYARSAAGDEVIERRINTLNDKWNKSLDAFTSEQSQFRYNNYRTVKEMTDELKAEGLKKIPTKRKELEIFYTKHNVKGEVKRSPGIGNLHHGDYLVIMTEDQPTKDLMSKIEDIHKSGNLRMGSSANPYSRGSMLYDQRDLGPKSADWNRKTSEAQNKALEMVDGIKHKLIEKTTKDRFAGSLYSLSSTNADANTTDFDGVKYWLNYSPKGFRQIMGYFTKEELEKIADDDFSVVPQKN